MLFWKNLHSGQWSVVSCQWSVVRSYQLTTDN